MTEDDAPAGLGRGVAARLAALCLTRRGRLPVTHAPSDTVRAGLLVDLALTGRLTSTDHSIEVDPTPPASRPPTGCSPRWSRRRDRAQASALRASDSTGPGPG